MCKKEIVRLLGVLLKNEEQFKKYNAGLCYLVSELNEKEILTFSEAQNLLKFINNNRPKPGIFGLNPYYEKEMRHTSYFWKKGEWYPRERWLKHMIKKLS